MSIFFSIRAVGEWDGKNFRTSALQLTHKMQKTYEGAEKGKERSSSLALGTHQ